MNSILSLIGRNKELFTKDISKYNDELKRIVSSSTFLVIGGAGSIGQTVTKEHELILRPMEKLQIQKRGTIAQDFVEEVDYELDEKYKPGLFLQTKYFLEENIADFCSIDLQLNMYNTYAKMAGYSN